MVVVRSRSSKTRFSTAGIELVLDGRHKNKLPFAHGINILIILLLFAHPLVCTAVAQIENNVAACDKIITIEDETNNTTCVVDRSKLGPIKVISHGTKDDPFWQQIYAGMKQTADDMKIGLEMTLYDDDEKDLDESSLAAAMVEELQTYNARYASASGSGSDGDGLLPAAIIVSLPGDSRIETEVWKLGTTNIPIFGINAVGNQDEASWMFEGTVSMNETKAGRVAGNQIKDLLLSSSKDYGNAHGGIVTGIYINHRPDVQALQERFDGLTEATKDVVDSWKMVDLTKTTTEHELLALFEGCKDTVIQLAGGSGTIDAVLTALVANGCNIEDDHIMGTFDTASPLIYDALNEGTIKFAVSQQPYLQGSNSVLMAALYATTGQKLNNVVETGPVLITPQTVNFPTKEEQICEQEGFPVCSVVDPTTSGGDGGNHVVRTGCSCTDRSTISISVITHDGSSDDFWDTVFSGISQAATDFGVKIQNNAFKKATPLTTRKKQQGEHTRVQRLKHTFDINEACQARTTDGIIVSLPDASMVDAVAGCAYRGIPYLVMNAIAGNSAGDNNAQTDAQRMDDQTFGQLLLPYVGQKDFESGLEAGKRLIEAGVKKGWCLVHANFDTIHERCRGMETAFIDAKSIDDGNKIKFMGIINVPGINDISLYKQTVESEIKKNVNDDDDDWSGVGVLSTGRIQIPALRSLAKDHSEMIGGTFDLDSSFYSQNELHVPDQILFGIDQNAYLQGYLSVATMLWKISTSESATTTLETGPNFVVDSPDDKPTNSIGQQTTMCRDEGNTNEIKFCGSSKRDIISLSPEETAAEERPLTWPGKCENLGRPCKACEGDCNDDTDCGKGLVCYVRDSKTKSQDEPVPGCSTNPPEFFSKDFCVDARLYQCKDDDWIDVRAGQLTIARTCAYVEADLLRCKEYGRFCRKTCGYCRSEKDNGRESDY